MVNFNRLIVNQVENNFKLVSLVSNPIIGILILIFVNKSFRNSRPHRPANVGLAESVPESRRHANYFRFHEWYTARARVFACQKMTLVIINHEPPRTQKSLARSARGTQGTACQPLRKMLR